MVGFHVEPLNLAVFSSSFLSDRSFCFDLHCLIRDAACAFQVCGTKAGWLGDRRACGQGAAGWIGPVRVACGTGGDCGFGWEAARPRHRHLHLLHLLAHRLWGRCTPVLCQKGPPLAAPPPPAVVTGFPVATAGGGQKVAEPPSVVGAVMGDQNYMPGQPGCSSGERVALTKGRKLDNCMAKREQATGKPVQCKECLL